jgi:signal transduction histidine kinase
MLRRFAATVAVPGVILLGFGLRALQQDRLATDQQARDRLQRTAELAAREMDRQLVNWQQFRTDAAHPAYEIEDHPLTSTVDAGLAEAEQAEQVRGNIERAISLYRHAATAASPHVRAAALARLASRYLQAGRRDDAISAWRQLLQYPQQRIGPVPADLIARFELCSLGQSDRATFYHDLVSGRWKLDQARYLFYADTARDWVSDSDPARAVEREKLATAAAMESFRENRRRWLGGYIAFWQGADCMIVPAPVVRARLERFAFVDREVAIKLLDANALRPSVAAYQPLADRELPWTVAALPVDVSRLTAGADQRRSIYLVMLLLVFALLMVGGYITARASRRELEVARLKSDFVATVSHEFRSPLTAIRQLSELLERGRVPNEEKRREYYALISRESGRLSRLVENLLDFSRMEDGRKQYHFDRMETAEWLREAASRFEKANLTMSIPPELPPIMGDRVALSSAVDNLLDNAVKYSPPGAPVVCVVEAQGHELTIRVCDHGCGIAAQDRDHVFEKFYRGNGEIARQVKGAGVGLSLVRQIVEAHGGTVDFESTVGEGSVFRIRLKTA